MDVLILSTSSKEEVLFWEKRLKAQRGSLLKPDCEVIGIHEERPLGNGLGTLYAFSKANEKFPLLEALEKGKSVALYHTAGKGTRLAPLPLAEGNSKSRVKLPSLLQIEGEKKPMTILEAVIKQTAVFSERLQGRLGVFWGDQLFFEECIPHTPLPDIELLSMGLSVPYDSILWEQKGLNKYGLLIKTQSKTCQVEKLSYESFTRLTAQPLYHPLSLAISLGCFSLSKKALLEFVFLFQKDLSQETPLNCDPHFWMPLTLDLKTYLSLIKEEASFLEKHYSRLDPVRHLTFSHLDLGPNTLWWDLGSSLKYYENLMKLIEDSSESRFMRAFFGLQKEGSSIIQESSIGKKHIHKSILVGVTADKVEAHQSLMIDVISPEVKAERSLIYHSLDTMPIEVVDQIRTDVLTDHHTLHLFKPLDSQPHWHDNLNALSFEEVYQLNQKEPLSESKAHHMKETLLCQINAAS